MLVIIILDVFDELIEIDIKIKKGSVFRVYLEK